jgi:hypothetical protein
MSDVFVPAYLVSRMRDAALLDAKWYSLYGTGGHVPVEWVREKLDEIAEQLGRTDDEYTTDLMVPIYRRLQNSLSMNEAGELVDEPRGNPGRPRQNRGTPRDHETARKNWTMWNDKPEPRREFTKSVKQLNEPYFVCVGKAEEILYSSDKWEKDGDHHDYVHTFETHPGVYIPESAAGDEDVIGRPKKTLSILGLSTSRKQLAVTELAKVKDFTFKDKNGDLVAIELGRGAILASTPDKKCIIILAKNGPVLVRGGKMVVTARGIVN